MVLSTQKQKMLEMRSFLEDFCVLLNSRIDGLKDKLEQFVAQGFPSDIAMYYLQSYYMSEKQEINNLIQTVQTAHYSYIDEVVTDIDAAMNRK